MTARRLLTGAALTACLLAGAWGDGPSGLPPCQVEDETGCYWDAQTMGNGRGTDSVVLEGEGQ